VNELIWASLLPEGGLIKHAVDWSPAELNRFLAGEIVTPRYELWVKRNGRMVQVFPEDLPRRSIGMTREQQLEKELAELRKAKSLLLDRLDDAGKKSLEEKARLYDAVLPLVCIQVKEALGENNGAVPTNDTVAHKVTEAVIGTDGVVMLEKLE
jgi:hypothetical protein